MFKDKYSKLMMDLIEKGCKVHFFAIEVGVQGLVDRSSYNILREVGLPSRESKIMKRMLDAAVTASHWLWTKRDSQ